MLVADSSVEAGLAAGLSVEAELEVAAQCSWAAAYWSVAVYSFVVDLWEVVCWTGVVCWSADELMSVEACLLVEGYLFVRAAGSERPLVEDCWILNMWECIERRQQSDHFFDWDHGSESPEFAFGWAPALEWLWVP